MLFNFATNEDDTKLDGYKKYLFIGAHPSDIEMACGGIIAALSGQGKEIHYLICTDGRYTFSGNNPNPSVLLTTRKTETRSAADFMKVKSVTILDFPNGGLFNIEDMKKAIIRKLFEIKPDIVFAPDFANSNDLNPDHFKVAHAVRESVLVASHPEIMKECNVSELTTVSAVALYWTLTPNTYFDVTEFIKVRFELLAFHSSHFPIDPGDDVSYEFQAVKESSVRDLRQNGDKIACNYAEGYRVLSKNGVGGYPAFNLHPNFCS
jgi:Uncharacterized proteins, LmbE homologs